MYLLTDIKNITLKNTWEYGLFKNIIKWILEYDILCEYLCLARTGGTCTFLVPKFTINITVNRAWFHATHLFCHNSTLLTTTTTWVRGDVGLKIKAELFNGTVSATKNGFARTVPAINYKFARKCSKLTPSDSIS